MVIKFDWQHALILAGTTIGGAILGYFESQPVTSLFAAFGSWETAKPLVFGALYASLAALLALAKKGFLVKEPPAAVPPMAMRPMAVPKVTFAEDAPSKPNAARTTLIFPAGMALCLSMSGCSWLGSPQGAAAVKGGVDLALCVLSHSSEPVQQIVTDCGASTAEDVVKILDAHRAATVRESSADAGCK